MGNLSTLRCLGKSPGDAERFLCGFVVLVEVEHYSARWGMKRRRPVFLTDIDMAMLLNALDAVQCVCYIFSM